jgi:hypothetical protein
MVSVLLGLDDAVEGIEDPGTLRWTSRGPLGFTAGDANVYRYAGNAPILETDPSGLQVGAVVVLPKKYPKGRPTFEQALKDPDLQCVMQQIYREYKNDPQKREHARWILWNPATGQIGVTEVGVTLVDGGHVRLAPPTIPGWVPIGNMHTHPATTGSISPSGVGPNDPDFLDPDNLDTDLGNAWRRWGLPGVVVKGLRYHPYGPGVKKTTTRQMAPCPAANPAGQNGPAMEEK